MKLINLSKNLLLTVSWILIIKYLNNAFIYFLLILFFTYDLKLNKKNKSDNQKTLILFVIIYNIYNLYLVYLNKYLLFWDNQYLFHKFNCNLKISTYSLRLDFSKYDCPNSLGFGILQDLTSLSLDPWISSIIIYFLCVIFLIFIYKFTSGENKKLLSYFFVSPAFLFLINSLNSDIFFLIFCFYLIIKKKLNLNIFDFFIISFLIQLKIYPIALLLGYLIYSILNLNPKRIIFNSIFFIFNVTILFYYLFSNSNTTFYKTFLGVPLVYAPLSSFGLMADIFTFFDVPLTKELGNFNLIKIFLFLFLIVVAFITPKKIKNFQLKLSSFTQNQLTVFLPLIFLINLFGNHGYKFVFNFLIIYICFESLNNFEKIFMIVLIFIFPINFILANNSYPLLPMFSANFYSTSIWFTSRFIFYIFNYFLLVYYFLVIKVKIFKN